MNGFAKDFCEYDQLGYIGFSPPARWGSLDFNKGATPPFFLLPLLVPPPSSTLSFLLCQLRMQWANLGPEHCIASSGCSGPRVDRNSISRAPAVGSGCSAPCLGTNMPDRMSECMAGRTLEESCFLQFKCWLGYAQPWKCLERGTAHRCSPSSIWRAS